MQSIDYEDPLSILLLAPGNTHQVHLPDFFTLPSSPCPGNNSVESPQLSVLASAPSQKNEQQMHQPPSSTLPTTSSLSNSPIDYAGLSMPALTTKRVGHPGSLSLPSPPLLHNELLPSTLPPNNE